MAADDDRATETVIAAARELAAAVHRANEHGGEHQAAVAHQLARLVAAVEAMDGVPDRADQTEPSGVVHAIDVAAAQDAAVSAR